MENEGWLTNGFFAIYKSLEPKVSQKLRYIQTDNKIKESVEKWVAKLDIYETAEIVNDIRYSYDKTFLIKLKSENYEVWCNPKYLSYCLAGTGDRHLEIKIGKTFSDPILLMRDNDILAAVMPFRNQDEE